MSPATTTATLAEDDTATLPEGWVVTHLGEICEINPPKPASDALPADAPVTFAPMPAVDAVEGAITAPQTKAFAEVRKGFTSFRNNDVIMAKITPCMENGKAAITRNLTNGLGFGSTEFHVLRPTGAILPEYVYSFIRQESYRRTAESEMTGSVGQKRVPQSFLDLSEFPLPPLAEQIRIVKKLTELLNAVKACRERLMKVPLILKRFRQAVLAAACSGGLTKEWRTANLESDQWRECLMEDVADYIGGYAYRSPTFSPSGMHQVIRIGNVRPFVLNLAASPVFISDELADETDRFRLCSGDVLISMTGTKFKRDYGFAAIFDDVSDRSLFLNQRVGRLRAKPCILPFFLLYLLQTASFRNFFFEGETGNVNQGNVGADGIRKALISLPSIAEQHEIVRRVHGLLRLADAIQEKVRACTGRAEVLTQSILAKGFRGELVPTEAELARREGWDYEPASVLLERIRAERADQAKSMTASTRKLRRASAHV